MNGPPGLIPLALLTNDAAPRLPELLRRADERLESAGFSRADHAEVLTACQILLGLRYDGAVIQSLFRELRTMRESSGYQLILSEGITQGEAREAQSLILRLGGKKFGPAPESVQTAIRNITDREQLEQIAERVLDASDWDDLLSPL